MKRKKGKKIKCTYKDERDADTIADDDDEQEDVPCIEEHKSHENLQENIITRTENYAYAPTL